MRHLSLFGIVLCAALLLGAGCASHSTSVKSTETSPIKIGFISPLTGDAASVGVAGRQAVELAVEEVNATGGINGRRLELRVEDGKCSPRDATLAASKLMDIDRVVAIVGGLCSSETSAFAPSAMQKKVIVLSHGSSAPSLSNTGKYFFRSYPSDAFQGSYAATYVYQTLGIRRVAILFHQTEYGTSARDIFAQRFQELGGQIVAVDGAPQEARDYRSLITKIQSSNPELVYAPTYPEGAIVLVKQMREQGMNIPILGGDGWGDTKLHTELASLKGILFVQPKATVAPEAFKQALLAKTGGAEVTVTTQQAYDNVKILAQAFTNVGTDADKVADYLRGLRYMGVSGSIDFDANGDLVSATYQVVELQDGKVRERT